ncbi:MAG: S8 family serine peptidase, partial [Candidatus Saccharibacteria bacterium]
IIQKQIMISKHILFAGLTILTGSTLVLQTVSTVQLTTLPSDPIITFHAKSSGQLLANAIQTHSAIIPQPQIASESSNLIPASPTHAVIPPLPEPALVRPIRGDQPDAVYSALPFTSGTVTAQAGSSPWWLTTIHNPTTPSTGPSTLIAVIDTGFALNHTSLSSRWWTNSGEMGPTTVEGGAPNCTSRGLALDKSCNNLDNDADGYPSDWRGYDFANNDNDAQAGTTNSNGGAVEHGTFIAGLIAGTLTSTSGGVDTNARIMPIQALTDNGSGSTTTVGDAIVFAADHGAQIISLSLGTSSDDAYIHETIGYAIAKGSIVVAAAGNDGCNCMLYPANYPEVISVGATTMSDTLASFSSYGANLDLIAPGQDLCSTTWYSSNETTAYVCGGAGTSFATPIVAGTLSRLISSGAIKDIAGQYADIGADKLSAMNGSWRTDQYGTGRVDVAASLAIVPITSHLLVQNALIRNSCNGINPCSIGIATSLGNGSFSSKAVLGQASSVYWESASSSGTPTLWMVTNNNTGAIRYYSSV